MGYLLGGILVAVIANGVIMYFMLRELHFTMNSRLDELIVTTRALARAEGFKAAQDEAAEDRLEAIRATGAQRE